MDNLYEVYLDVYQVDEGLGSAIKRIFSGKKEAEAPKPESRGAYLRRKYNVGPERSDTSAKRKILDRSQAHVKAAQRQVDIGNASKSYADAASAAHDRYLKAGYSKYGANLKRGRGNKARRRAEALQREDFEYIVNTLIEEGYDLSSYTWSEMYEICVNEIEDLYEAQMGPIEQVDLYDLILSHLLYEGYADTEQAAEVIMVNMSEEWRESIVEEKEKLPYKTMMDKSDELATIGGKKNEKRSAKIYIAANDPKHKVNEG